MAVTKGHGNPNWTRDEVILALDLYFQCSGRMPSASDPRVRELSEILRAFPYHNIAVRKDSFRNHDGVAFKLQNLRQLDTGKGLVNVSKVDREVWESLGSNPDRTKELAKLIRSGIKLVKGLPQDEAEVEFSEGKIVTETHLRRERNTKLRRMLIAIRIDQGKLECDLCRQSGDSIDSQVREAMFECHHIIPLGIDGARTTRLKDMAMLCANCHRLVHRTIALKKRWLSIAEAKHFIFGES